MTSTDIAYCVSQVCPSRATCRRAHPPQYAKWLPMSDFYESGTQMCVMYRPYWNEAES